MPDERHCIEVASYVPTGVWLGEGALDRLPQVLERIAPATCDAPILLLTGTRSASEDWQLSIREALRRYRYTSIKTPPGLLSIETCEQLRRSAAACGPVSAIVAVGGGRTLDAAKVLALSLRADCSVLELLSDDVKQTRRDLFARPLLVTIPTTAGSGSEVTCFATLWDTTRQRKRSLSGDDVFPSAALVDPRVIRSLAREHLISAALDTFVHAIEASWSTRSDAESRTFAMRALAASVETLDALVRADLDSAGLAVACKASNWAGMAIVRSQTTAAHAVSYPLTLRYGIAHGRACALMIAPLLRFNAQISSEDCADPRGVEHVRSVLASLFEKLGARDGREAERRVAALVASLAPELALVRRTTDVQYLHREVCSYDRMRNNPRMLDADSLWRLLELGFGADATGWKEPQCESA